MQNKKETQKEDINTLSAYFDAELRNGEIKGNIPEKEAHNMSRFEKAQQICDEMGTVAILESLMDIPCDHEVILPNGAKFPMRIQVPPHLVVEYDDELHSEVLLEVAEQICPACGKTLQIKERRVVTERKQLQKLLGDQSVEDY